MRAGGTRVVATAVAASTVALATAGTAEAKRGDCIRNAPDGYTIARSNGQAVLFEAGGKRYGCAYNRGVVRKLPGQDPESNASNTLFRDHFEFQRRWVAYGSVWRRYSDGARELRVHSFNLKTGADRRSKGWQEAALGSLVLKNNGSVAWLYTWPVGKKRVFARVAKIDQTTLPGERQLASDEGSPQGRKIAPSSLHLLPGGSKVGWSDVGGRADSDWLK